MIIDAKQVLRYIRFRHRALDRWRNPSFHCAETAQDTLIWAWVIFPPLTHGYTYHEIYDDDASV